MYCQFFRINYIADFEKIANYHFTAINKEKKSAEKNETTIRMIQENISDIISKDTFECPSVRRRKLNEGHRGYTGCSLPPEISIKLTPEVKETLSNIVRYGKEEESVFVFDKLRDEKKKKKRKGQKKNKINDIVDCIASKTRYDDTYNNIYSPMNF